jgi:phosphohistidine phosphatase
MIPPPFGTLAVHCARPRRAIPPAGAACLPTKEPRMELYVVRHAIAEVRDSARWPDDAQRPLTDRGRDRFRPVAELLARVAPDVSVVLSSGFVRAWQTAELLAEHAGWPPPIHCPELEFEPSGAVCESLAGQGAEGAVAVVGHEPSLSELVSYLLTGSDEAVAVDMKKGGVVWLSFPAAGQPGAATLRWYLTPRLARAVT